MGRARAAIYVARKGVNNIKEALYFKKSDKENLDWIAKKKEEWNAIMVQQRYMMNGEQESIEIVLEEMKIFEKKEWIL